MPINDIQTIIETARNRLLEMHFHANCGHIGGNVSCLDAMIILHHRVLNPDDRFILSKGHSAGALYVTLWTLGKMNDADLKTFAQNNTMLPCHPSSSGIFGLLFPTGSLGHGPSLAAGLALAAKHNNVPRHIYCLCSDGEWQEGSCWEALIFSVHHRLNNLTIIIDQNGLQGFGTTKEIISCSDLTPRIEAFGAHVQHADGHNCGEILKSLESKSADKVNILILNTIKGKGLAFENTLESHYLPLTEQEYRTACSINTQRGDL